MNHTVICPYGAYQCRDGALVVITVQHSGEWAKFCEQILGDASLATDPRFHDNTARINNKPALEILIKAEFATHDRAQMLKRLDAAGIASGAVNDVASLSDHPQLDRSTVGTPSGEINVPMPPIRRNGGETDLGPCPAFDAEGQALRAEFGPRSEKG